MLKRLFIFIVGQLLLCELILRLAGLSFPVWSEKDPVVGWKLRAGASGWIFRESIEHIEINSEGFRSRLFAKDRQPDTLRIAILGDSFAEAKQVSFDETFFSRMEKPVAECSEGKGVEILNFGVSGYGTAQELLTYRAAVKDYAPDLVVLMFFAGNDLVNNSRELSGPEVLQPYFLEKDGALAEDLSFSHRPEFLDVDGPVKRILERSYLAQLVKEIVQVTRSLRYWSNWTMNRENDPEIFRPPRQDTWERAWLLTEKIVGKMNEEIQTAKSKFLLAVVSHPLQVDPDPAVREAFAQSIGMTNLAYPDSRLAALGEALEFPVVSLSKKFLEASPAGRCLHGQFRKGQQCTGHWNALGHAEAASVLAAEVCRIVKAEPQH